MPAATAQTRAKAAEKKSLPARVALVGPEPLALKVGEALRPQQLAVLVFEHTEDLPPETTKDDGDLAAIVLCTDDTGTSLGRSIDALGQRFTQTPIVVLCSSIRKWEVHAALAAGAAGLVLQEDMERALAPCIEAVRARQVCVPRGDWRQIEPPALSSREKQILGLVVMGYMNSQIAEQLFLAESTIKSHLSSAFGKLGVRSRHEAVNLILNPDGGLGLGILGLGGEPIELASAELTA